jgi:uncharacterized protein (TIGR00369 family)
MSALSAERAAFLARDFVRGFPAAIGFAVSQMDFGVCESSLEVEPRHAQQDGYVHAGVIGTMADHTMGYAAFSVVAETKRILTIEFKINFLRPASGSRLLCRGRVIQTGELVIATEAEVFSILDGQRTLVSIASANMAQV